MSEEKLLKEIEELKLQVAELQTRSKGLVELVTSLFKLANTYKDMQVQLDEALNLSVTRLELRALMDDVFSYVEECDAEGRNEWYDSFNHLWDAGVALFDLLDKDGCNESFTDAHLQFCQTFKELKTAYDEEFGED